MNLRSPFWREYFFFIVLLALSVVAQETVAQTGPIVSDDFNSSTLNLSRWRFVNPGIPSVLSMTGTGTSNARLSIAIPANSSHDAWTGGNFAPRILQSAPNADFQVEVKFESVLNAKYQMQGILVEQDSNNYLRFDFVRDAAGVKVFSATVLNGVPTAKYSASVSNGNPLYLRVKKQGIQWTQTFSYNGTTWTNAARYNQNITVKSVGVFAGNAGSPAPAFTALVDYFFNSVSPVTPEDGAVVPTISVHPVSQGVTAGQSATFSISASGTAPLSFQWTKNGATISGATSSSYTTPPTALTDHGASFRCIVSNQVSGVTSNPAILSITAVPPTITSQPVVQVIAVGTQAQFTVAANGTLPISYQWERNGIAIPDANSFSYIAPIATHADSGSTYRCVITNIAGTITSNEAILHVLFPVNIIVQPENQSVANGDTAAFSVVTAGSALITFQWQKNGIPIAGATTSSFVIPSTTPDDDGALFRCIVSNPISTETSAVALLAVSFPPQITAHPVPFWTSPDNSAIFSVTTEGTFPLSYQWHRDGADISSATDSVLAIALTEQADSGSTFRCIVTNAFGSAQSNDAALHILALPSIVDHPDGIAVLEGETATFAVGSAGGQPFLFQWQRDGIDIPGSTDSTLTIDSAGTGDHGVSFRCIVFNQVGSDTSSDAVLVVNSPVFVTFHPEDRHVTEGTNPLFEVRAAGTGPITFQWQMNEVDLPSANDSVHITPTTSIGDSGATFRCIVSNAFGSDTTDEAILHVGTPPEITAQPAGQTVDPGTPATFSIQSSRPESDSYQWERNGINIAGAVDSVYVTPSVTVADDSALFRCLVSNNFGTTISTEAMLIVNTPSDTLSPVLSSIQATPLKLTATITWTTDEPSTSGVEYGMSTAYESGLAEDQTLTTQHRVVLTNLIPGQTYHFRISSVDTAGNITTSQDLLFTAIIAILSDDFNGFVINTGIWKFTNPGGGVHNVTGINTPNARLTIFIPGGTPHDIWTGGNFGSRMMQASPNADFELEAKFESPMTAPYQTHGILVEKDSANFIRFDFVRGPTGTKIFAASFVNGVPTKWKDALITAGNPLYLRVKRVGNQWTESYSLNGTTYVHAVTFSHTIAVKQVGVFAGNAGTNAPAFLSIVDYFQNNASPIAQEDGVVATSLPIITDQPASQTKSIGQQAIFSVTALGTHPISYQWQRNGHEIAGATQPSYTTPHLARGDSGSIFRCRIVNSLGVVYSNAASLHVDANAGPMTLRFKRATIDNTNLQDHHCKATGDVSGDGFPDILAASAVDTSEGAFWFKYPSWTKHRISSGTFETEMQVCDIDGDGDQDVVIPKDIDATSFARQCVWYENPLPTGNPSDPWVEHLIGDAVGHDIEVADMNADGKIDVIVRHDSTVLFTQQSPTSWTKNTLNTRPSEGLALGDIDKDGDLDIAINGFWLENTLPPGTPSTGLWPEWSINAAWPTQVAPMIADINLDGKPDVFYAPSHTANGKLSWYETANPKAGPWFEHIIDGNVSYLHSIKSGDMDNDGDIDLVTAEMHQSDDPDNVSIYLNDGLGSSWTVYIVDSTGSHNQRVADIGNDGDLDIVGANWSATAPNGSTIDLWENTSFRRLPLDQWQRHVIDPAKPWRTVFVTAEDIDGDAKKDIVTGGWWYKNPGGASETWSRNTVGAPLNNMGAVFDIDADGDKDIFGTKGQGTTPNAEFLWARNNGDGIFTMYQNIAPGTGDFLQGIVIEKFQNNRTEMALSWHNGGVGVQMLSVPTTPADSTWAIRLLSSTSQDEQLSQGDIDSDGDTDILMGTQWFRNEGSSWSAITLSNNPGLPDRNRLIDMNNDGRLDAVVGYQALSIPGPLVWYEQPASVAGLWVEHTIADTVIGPMSIDVADFDGDGDVDVVVGEHHLASPASARLLIFENMDGTGGSWQSHHVYTGDEHHDGAQSVDIDGDGDLDVISIGWDNPRVVLYENLAMNVATASPRFPASKELETFSTPTSFVLHQNYPNPFNASTTIQYDLPKQAIVTLSLFNVLGQHVGTVVNEPQAPGVYRVQWNAVNLASGVYLYRLTAGSMVSTKKLLLLK